MFKCSQKEKELRITNQTIGMNSTIALSKCQNRTRKSPCLEVELDRKLEVTLRFFSDVRESEVIRPYSKLFGFWSHGQDEPKKRLIQLLSNFFSMANEQEYGTY